MGIGIIGGAMAGAGAGALEAGKQYGDYLSKSTLQQEQDTMQQARDARLSELRKGELAYADELQRKPGMEAAAEIETAKKTPVDDLSGTARPRNATEMADAEEGAYRKRGMVREAMDVRREERARQSDATHHMETTDQHNIERDRLASQDKYQNAMVAIHSAAEGRMKAGAEIDNAIKNIGLENAKRLDTLRTEYGTATGERKDQIRDEMAIISGKDKEKYLPVPLKDDMGNVTGYKVFDTIRGKWMDDQAGPGPGPGKKGERPALDSFFKKPKAAAAPGPSSTPAAAPAAAPDNSRVTVPGMGVLTKSEIPARIASFQALFSQAQQQNDTAEMQRVGAVIQSLKAAQERPGI